VNVYEKSRMTPVAADTDDKLESIASCLCNEL